MLKIFLGILGVILVVALLTNNSSEKTQAVAPPAPVAGQQPASGSSGAAAKVNPAHGQPGHRCDIAVGALLPSGPAAAAPGAPSAPATDMAPVREEADAAIALNPAHGQPGHVCEVPVGRPLPKK